MPAKPSSTRRALRLRLPRHAHAPTHTHTHARKSMKLPTMYATFQLPCWATFSLLSSFPPSWLPSPPRCLLHSSLTAFSLTGSSLPHPLPYFSPSSLRYLLHLFCPPPASLATFFTLLPARAELNFHFHFVSGVSCRPPPPPPFLLCHCRCVCPC